MTIIAVLKRLARRLNGQAGALRTTNTVPACRQPQRIDLCGFANAQINHKATKE